ncbi:hypothetical protein OAN24_01660 [Pseudodesulfovibrio sp.]|nr:hypothetical protein [Pseudodesulfovibrio sp.]
MSEHAPGMIRPLISYAIIYLIAHLLVLSVFAIYLVSELIMTVGNEEAGWGLLILNWTALTAAFVANCFALYYLFKYDAMTRRRLQFVVIFTGIVVAGYSLLAMLVSVGALAWTYGILAVLLLPIPVILSRPTALAAILALPVEPDDNFYDDLS